MIAATVLEIYPPAWHHDAICSQTDPDAFYPEQGGTGAKAKAVCAGCPLTGQDGPCLQYALDHDEKFGIWGGYTEDERRQFTGRQRRKDRWEEAA